MRRGGLLAATKPAFLPEIRCLVVYVTVRETTTPRPGNRRGGYGYGGRGPRRTELTPNSLSPKWGRR